MVRRNTRPKTEAVSTPCAERLALACAELRRHGLPLTVQRRALLEQFVARTDHPSVEMLYADLADTLPGVNRATVYRTLEMLVELGLASRLAHPSAECRYDPHVARHHHLVCDNCGAVEDHVAPALDAFAFPTLASGFVPRDYSVQFRGLCARCTRPRSGKSKRGDA